MSKKSCKDCIHYNKFNDGTVDGKTYWDIWCNKTDNVESWISKFDYKRAETCEDYKVDKS